MKRPHAGNQRQDRAAGQTERMEHRHRVEHRVATMKVDHRRQLRAIRQNVTMAQHDAFGAAFGAAGEQHDGRHRRDRRARQAAAAANQASNLPASLRAMPMRGANVLQPDEPYVC